MKKPKIFICWTTNSGTSFYRLFNYIKYLNDDFDFGYSKWKPDFQGLPEWEFMINDPKHGALISKDIHFLLSECQMVIAQKFNSQGGMAVMDMCQDLFPKKNFYMEIDDHIFAVNPSAPAYQTYHPGSEQEEIAKEQLSRSTGLIVSTEYLKKVYSQFNANIFVVPNAIDFAVWDKLKAPKPHKKVRIGWAGGGTHVDDLEFIIPAIKKVLEKNKNLEFVFLGGVPDSLQGQPGINAIAKWYAIDKYPQELANLGIDIAIAPLRDNHFNRGKSNLRWLEYSALKIPTVASNVEPYKCIENGNTGKLVTEVDEWVEALLELASNKELRTKIGQSAYEKVKSDYNCKKIAKKYGEYMRLMLQNKGLFNPDSLISVMT